MIVNIWQKLKSTSFESDRLRKNLKAALKSANIEFNSNKIDQDADVVHFLYPFDQKHIDQAFDEDKKIIVSAFYTENEKMSSLSNIKTVKKINRITISTAEAKRLMKADVILVPNVEYKEVLARKGIDFDKIEVVNPGVNTSIYKYLTENDMDLARRYYSINSSQKIVLLFGSAEDKEAMKRLKRLAQTRSDAKFVFVSSTPVKKKNFLEITFGFMKKEAPNVIITDFKDINVYRSLLKNARCLVYLTSYVTDEIQINEAFASELQVISLKSSLPERYYDSDILYCHEDINDLFKSVANYLDYKISPTISNASFYIEKYDVSNIGNQLKEIYNKLVNREK